MHSQPLCSIYHLDGQLDDYMFKCCDNKTFQGHLTCTECIKIWFTKANTCPISRAILY